jgi:hypothetical protein
MSATVARSDYETRGSSAYQARLGFTGCRLSIFNKFIRHASDSNYQRYNGVAAKLWQVSRAMRESFSLPLPVHSVLVQAHL